MTAIHICRYCTICPLFIQQQHQWWQQLQKISGHPRGQQVQRNDLRFWVWRGGQEKAKQVFQEPGEGTGRETPKRWAHESVPCSCWISVQCRVYCLFWVECFIKFTVFWEISCRSVYSGVCDFHGWLAIPDKADRKRNRANSDEDEYNPEQEAKKRRKGDYEVEDDDEDGDDSDYEAVAGKVRIVSTFHCTANRQDRYVLTCPSSSLYNSLFQKIIVYILDIFKIFSIVFILWVITFFYIIQTTYSR